MANSSRPILRRFIVVCAVGACVIAAIALMCVDVIPKRAMTKTAMVETSVRIGLFVERNKKLPTDLGKLPNRDGYMNRITDAWKRQLIYGVISADSFTLTSLGRHGVVGGTGDDEDIALRYQIINGDVRQMP